MSNTKISDTPWGSFKESDYDLQQWIRACLIHPDKPSEDKENYKLPVREPDGTLNKNGVYAAASALAGGRGGVSATSAQKTSAAKKLVSLYGKLDAEVPPSIESLTHFDTEGFIAHFGRKGMKWGVRHTPAELAKPGALHPASEDAQRHQQSLSKISSGGTHALSDKEFKAVVNRMQMQQQYGELVSKASGKSKIDKGHDSVKKILAFGATGIALYNLANHPATKAGLKIVTQAAKTHVPKHAASPAASTALALVR